MNIYIESLGCFKNSADTEELVNLLTKVNFKITNRIDESDVMIINTCGFIEPAVEESIDRILELAKYKDENRKLIAFGCMIERYINEIHNLIPEIDKVFGVNCFNELVDYLISIDKKNAHKSLNNPHYLHTHLPYYSFIKIADGCDNRCSYCMIPMIKGGLKSLDINKIVQNVKNVLLLGVKEIILIAQDISKYGIDLYGREKLTDLLEELNKIDKEFFIRLLYVNPDGIDDRLINQIKDYEKIIKYLDVPIQHTSDKILKAMNRKIDSYRLNLLFEKLRTELPELTIRTTIIVGFPGEEEDDFKRNIDFLERYKPEWLGVFPFYAEEGTSAYSLKGRVKKTVVNERINALNSLQMRNTTLKFNNLIGVNTKVFIEDYNSKKKIFVGRTLMQSPEIDGMCYIKFDKDSRLKTYGPYNAVIDNFDYPDIFVTAHYNNN
ncbi:MAG: 30S ribosomal protein S12 methylthiotransferase RimO [Deferribacterota bacterium]|nr:30S ribosomal protein S12 methylthiotransferase RimO [Deferribacterota bacterium]